MASDARALRLKRLVRRRRPLAPPPSSFAASSGASRFVSLIRRELGRVRARPLGPLDSAASAPRHRAERAELSPPGAPPRRFRVGVAKPRGEIRGIGAGISSPRRSEPPSSAAASHARALELGDRERLQARGLVAFGDGVGLLGLGRRARRCLRGAQARRRASCGDASRRSRLRVPLAALELLAGRVTSTACAFEASEGTGRVPWVRFEREARVDRGTGKRRRRILEPRSWGDDLVSRTSADAVGKGRGWVGRKRRIFARRFARRYFASYASERRRPRRSASTPGVQRAEARVVFRPRVPRRPSASPGRARRSASTSACRRSSCRTAPRAAASSRHTWREAPPLERPRRRSAGAGRLVPRADAEH